MISVQPHRNLSVVSICPAVAGPPLVSISTRPKLLAARITFADFAWFAVEAGGPLKARPESHPTGSALVCFASPQTCLAFLLPCSASGLVWFERLLGCSRIKTGTGDTAAHGFTSNPVCGGTKQTCFVFLPLCSKANQAYFSAKPDGGSVFVTVWDATKTRSEGILGGSAPKQYCFVTNKRGEMISQRG
jgi:hypothetical protein